jgi:hypothetical protein
MIKAEKLIERANIGRLVVEEDGRPNMEWNNHICRESDPNMTVCFMANSGKPDNSEYKAAAELFVHLVNHASALVELVKAARIALDEMNNLNTVLAQEFNADPNDDKEKILNLEKAISALKDF